MRLACAWPLLIGLAPSQRLAAAPELAQPDGVRQGAARGGLCVLARSLVRRGELGARRPRGRARALRSPPRAPRAPGVA